MTDERNFQITAHYVSHYCPNVGTFTVIWYESGKKKTLSGIPYYLSESGKHFVRMPYREGFRDHQKKEGECDYLIYQDGEGDDFKEFINIIKGLFQQYADNKALKFVEVEKKKEEPRHVRPRRPFKKREADQPRGTFSTAKGGVTIPKFKPNAFVDLSSRLKPQ